MCTPSRSRFAHSRLELRRGRTCQQPLHCTKCYVLVATGSGAPPPPAMPVLHQEDYLSADIPAIEILQRRSINSLLGLQSGISETMSGRQDYEAPNTTPELLCYDQQTNYIGNAQRNYCIPVGRVPLMDEFPNSPEGGQIPQYGSQYSCLNSPEKSLSAYDKLSECDNIINDLGLLRHPDSPDSSHALSTPSSCSNIDGSITELMNGLSLNMSSLPSDYQQNQRGNSGFCTSSTNQDGNEATCTWRGTLPFRMRFSSSSFSPKIFLGGLPWDADEKTLVQTFKRFGPIRVDWPGKENNSPQPKGFVYIIFQTERQVRYLLAASTYDNTGNWYFTVSTKKMRSKQVQIIPWDKQDSKFQKNPSVKLDRSRTVFVGALHGMLTAHGLAKIMDDLFGGVVFAGIDTDKNEYPIGSGRVTFDNFYSYVLAVKAAFINIKTEKFYKKIQVDPYLDDNICSVCNVQQGHYFCRMPSCFRYFCRSCWIWQHPTDNHKALSRSKSSTSMNGVNYNQGRRGAQLTTQSSLMEPNCNNPMILCSHSNSNCMRFRLINTYGNNVQDM